MAAPSGRKNGNYRHGYAGTPTYCSWRNMRKRCYLLSDPYYADYGGRGITVCARWRSFGRFLSDMGVRPAGRTLDRVNNARGYSPSNCRWATPLEQASNRRTRRA